LLAFSFQAFHIEMMAFRLSVDIFAIISAYAFAEAFRCAADISLFTFAAAITPPPLFSLLRPLAITIAASFSPLHIIY